MRARTRSPAHLPRPRLVCPPPLRPAGGRTGRPGRPPPLTWGVPGALLVCPPRRRFQAAGPFWGRQYLFWRGGKPLTLIYEVFSTELQALLGPMAAAPAE